MFVGEARISDVIASRRLASDWLGDDITWKCIGGYDSASAPLESEEDARLSTLPFSPPAVPPIPPPSILLVHSLPLSLRHTHALAVSVDRFLRRFHPCLSFPDFPNYPPACPPHFPLPPGGNFSVSAARTSGTPSSSISPLHTPSLSRIRFCYFIPFPPVLLRTEMPLPLHFHLTIILLLQILLAPLALSGKTSAPTRPVKFHYEINPGEYSYSERSPRFYYYLS